MMKLREFSLTSVLLVSAVMASVSPVAAQDTVSAERPTAAPATDGAAPEGEVTPVVDLRGDAGVDAVQQAQQEPPAKYVPNKTAEEQLQEFVQSKKWSVGWDEQKKRFFVVIAQAMNLDEPAADKDFYIKREMLAKRAVLRAKADIIQFILTKMSAADRLSVPGTDVNAQFGVAHNAAEAKLRSQKEKIAKLLKEHSEAEAAALAGATTRDRINSLLDAAIKRLDKEYSSAKVEAKKREQFAKAKARYAEATKELAEIEAQVQQFRGKVQSTQTSEVSRLASMPLIGATVIEQTESWNSDDEKYQVAVLVCWSAKLEQAARAVLTGEAIIEDAPKDGETLTVQAWLQQQELAQMVGPRQFLDASGQRWFVGITARPVSKNAATDENNRELAQIFAGQMAAFSLFADVDTQTTARQVMQVVSTANIDKSETKAMESLEQQLSQKFENLQIQGLGPLATKIVAHPLTGQKLYVVAYGMSPTSARAAMKLERQTALAAIQVHKSQAFMKGRSEAIEGAVNAAKNDSASTKAGRAKGQTEVDTAKTGKPKPGGALKTGGKTEIPGKTKSGSTKTGDVKDDF
ncbi:MAG: hypothetical protein NTY19_02605 [Planctomycetota bacterium]|nr:hypothetical protein [Planctomycetota bacterium]